MRTTLLTAGIGVALVLSLVAVWLAVRPTGTGTDVGGGGSVVFAGSWCCASCTGGQGGSPLVCTTCKTVPSGGSCPPQGGTVMTKLDCPGRTTDTAGTVTCY
jgi:hypothetical protein